MILSAMTTDSWRPRFLCSAAFLFNKDSKSVENTCNLARLGKNWNEFNLFQAYKIHLWNKMRTAIEKIGIGILNKELKEIKFWIGIKLLIETT